jgi:AcrR family transcriptional regulator
MPGDRDDDCRERLVDATLDLCMGQGYDATTVDQIAAAADVTPADFERHFATKDAAIMSVVDDLLQATAAALADVKAEVDPEHALLIATIELLAAIIEGRGVITRDRMLAMGRVVTSTSHLQQQASAVRKRVLTQARGPDGIRFPGSAGAARGNDVVGHHSRRLRRPASYAIQLRSAPR